jgi:phosphoglycolate phosphatase-like HAD superfamily hydrolase
MSWCPVTNSILGSAPLLDFDGTIAVLPVAWDRLRSELGVGRINDLWVANDPRSWSVVRTAEEDAARQAHPNPRLVEALEQVETLAVLTNNAETSVAVFLARFPSLERRVSLIVGREQLGGPKDEFSVFESGFRRCASATALARGAGALVYVGDADYELRFARSLGARALNVKEI